MSAYLQSLGSREWEICEDATYIVLGTRITQDQIDRRNANSRARNALFSCLSLSGFGRVSNLTTAREIWVKFQSYHEGLLRSRPDSFRRISVSMRTLSS